MATVPPTIALKHLSIAVDEAVKAAVTKHQAKVTAPFAINPGIICGPLLDAAIDLKTAQQIAEEITQQVQKSQVGVAAKAPLVSAVLASHGRIICGFFPYPAPVLDLER